MAYEAYIDENKSSLINAGNVSIADSKKNILL